MRNRVHNNGYSLAAMPCHNNLFVEDAVNNSRVMASRRVGLAIGRDTEDEGSSKVVVVCMRRNGYKERDQLRSVAHNALTS